VLYFVGGLVSVATQLAVGRTSDAIGRKPAALVMVALTAAGTLLLYRGSGAMVPAGWLLMVAAYLWMVLPLVFVPVALAALPETARRELEEIAPE